MWCALSHPQAAWVTSNPTGRSESSPILNLGHMVALASGKLLPLLTIHQPTEGEKHPTRPHTHQEAPCVPTHIDSPWVGAGTPQKGALSRLEGVCHFSAMSNHVQMLPSSHLFICAFTDCYVSFAFFCKVTFASDDSDSLVTIQFSWWSSFPLPQ